MSFNIIATPVFEKQIKILAKKHKSIKTDFANLISELEENPTKGTPLGNNCYKIRLAIKSKGKGKSGGARVITHIQIKDENIFLLDIYDKSDKDTLSDKEIKALLENL